MNTPVTKLTEAILVTAFQKAKAAAAMADPGEANDGGTCNFDSPACKFNYIKKEVIESAAKKAGVRANDFKWFGGKVYWWIECGFKGQANRRTRMAEAACKALQASGLAAQMYYQMD